MRHFAIVLAVCAPALIAHAAAPAPGGARPGRAALIPESAELCLSCHGESTPGIADHWKGSRHALAGVGCVECHRADPKDADAFEHYTVTIATVVTPRDCARCHEREAKEFGASHHAKGGNILASLDNRLAEVVEGARAPFNPHSPTPGMDVTTVSGMASANSGCRQCHGGKLALKATGGGSLTVDDFKPDTDGLPTAAMDRILRTDDGRPVYDPASWPNTGIGRINLDGSKGSCSACHSRHDFSARRARQPESCGKCHLGPDHPQKEVYEESKHGIAYRDLRDLMNLGAKKWVLGEDYSAAPTCATCHMSGHGGNGGRVTHDPGERISWTNRPPVSLLMDTGADHAVVTETDPEKRKAQVADTWQDKRERMKGVCANCHTPAYVDGFYAQYDDFVILFNEKFAKAGQAVMKALRVNGLLTAPEFDEPIEWTWYELWHHEGRRARHGASMMAPDYAHWHGMYEVAQRFYVHLIPEARALAKEAANRGKKKEAKAVESVIASILARPEHAWQGAAPAK